MSFVAVCYATGDAVLIGAHETINHPGSPARKTQKICWLRFCERIEEQTDPVRAE